MSNAVDEYLKKTNRILDAKKSKAVSEARRPMYRNLLTALLALGLLLIIATVMYHFLFKKPTVVEQIKIQIIEVPVEVEKIIKQPIYIEKPVYIDRYIKNNPADRISRDIPIAPRPDKTPGIQSGSGSGFFINAIGDVLTNRHVVAECSSIWIRNEERNIPGELLASSDDLDLAVVRTDAEIEMPALFTGNPIQTLEEVVAFGYPLAAQLGDEIKATKGNISSLSGYQGDVNMLSHTAAIQPGSSGGALVNQSGDVVGINTAKLVGEKIDNVNFAIKATAAQQFLNAFGINIGHSDNTDSISLQEMTDAGKRITVQILCDANIRKNQHPETPPQKNIGKSVERETENQNGGSQKSRTPEAKYRADNENISKSDQDRILEKSIDILKKEKQQYGCEFLIQEYIIEKNIEKFYDTEHNWNVWSVGIQTIIEKELGCK